MSTGKITPKINNSGNFHLRLAKIAKLGQLLFHSSDLASLWQIKNANTLHTTLKRYVQRGLLFRVYKGLYSLKPPKDINPELLGIKSLHRYAYISAEAVLFRAGIISQPPAAITLISDKSRKFSINGRKYYSRKLADRFLYNGAGVSDAGGFLRADANRAMADLLYFNPNAHFDAEKLINWREVKKIQAAVGYPLTLKRYDFTGQKRRET